MPQIYTDPEKLRQFSGDLERFAEIAHSHMEATKGRLGRLGDTWRDQEYEKFSHVFADAQKLLRKFVEETRRIAPLLQRDAEALEEYQKFKPNL